MDDRDLDGPRLIVGLGNPGAKYKNTRHNVGFECLTELLDRMGNPMPMAKFDGQFVKGKIDGRDSLLLWPLTYMNASGRSVAQVVGFFHVPTHHVLVVCDDISLPLGKLRMRSGGSSGGQKGLADTLRVLGTEEVPRLRIGIDPPPDRWDAADYVLGQFGEVEKETIRIALKRAADAVVDWLIKGIDHSMNVYNRDAI